MFRNGLIATVGLILILVSSHGSAKPDIYFRKKEFKNFEAGVRLLKNGRDDEAVSFFKKTTDADFILSDYSLLFMATRQYKLKNYSKALHYLEDVSDRQEAATIPYAERLTGEVALAQEQFETAFKAFMNFFMSKGIDENSSKLFRSLAESFSRYDADEVSSAKFYDLFFNFAKQNAGQVKKYDNLSAFGEIARTIGRDHELAAIHETAGDFKKAFDIARDRFLSADETALQWFAVMERLAQKQKDYGLKIKVLAEKLIHAKSQDESAETNFDLGLAHLNANSLRASLDYFRKASKSATRPFLYIKSYYYRGRVWEDLGDIKKAEFNYARAGAAKCQTEDEIAYVIKAMFRTGWLKYKSSGLKQAKRSFLAIMKKFGLRLSEEGYSFWLGMTYERLGEKEKAKKIFESTYTSFPLSYYGILSGIELKNKFDLDPPIKDLSLNDLVETLSASNEHKIDRAILLYSAGLEDFAKEEASRISIDYSNTREIYLTAVLNMLFDNSRKAISLIDFLINQKGGWPDEDILKLYYPVKFMNFITDYSSRAKVDPYLITSIIRQESVFHVEAVSKARAMGLMQIIPSLGFKKAKELSLGEISEKDLLNPEINIKVGISHFVELLKKFRNNIVYAVAAYNSSEKKVNEWVAESGKLPILEFIEDIPYFETRKYVKLNIRNYLNYLRIYSDKDWRKVNFEQGGF